MPNINNLNLFGTNYGIQGAVDNSLTTEGLAADAKAVGDALTTIRAQVGAPLVASTSSAMTDRTRIYVYTGTQTGYTKGNWYYWSGSAWTSGGVYNSVAVDTDKTLSVADQAADAKATGEVALGVDGLLNSNLNVTALEATTPSYNLRSPYVLMANGVVSEISGGDARYRITDYIPCECGQLIAFIHSCARYNNRNYAFYDENYNVVATSPRASSGELQMNVIRVPVPRKAKYFALSYDTQYTYPTGVKIITKWTESSSENGFLRINNIDSSTLTVTSVTSTTSSGEVVTRRGLISTGQTSTYKLTTADVTEGDVLFLQNVCAKYTNAAYCFFDVSGLYIDVLENEDSDTHNYTVVAPKGATQVVVSGYSTAATISKVARYTPGPGGSGGLKWAGKKWAAMGDSLTEANSRATKHYMDYIVDETGISYTNLGKSGTGYLKTYNSNQNFLNRVNTIPTDSDIVTIFGSGNDCSQTLGTVTDTVTNTVCGCINNTIDNIRSRIVGVKLGIIAPTPWDNYPTTTANNNMAKYCDALEEICNLKGVPFLNLYRNSNMVPWDATFRAAYYSHDDGNGVHPDENGHALFAPRIKAFMETLLM